MKTESKIQLVMAVIGVPLIFVLWKPDAKWPPIPNLDIVDDISAVVPATALSPFWAAPNAVPKFQKHI